MIVGDVCRKSVVTAEAAETVIEAARRMRDLHVGDIVVADASSRPIGMLTDRDIVVSALAQSPDKVQDLMIGDVMTRNVVTALRTESLDTALRRMRSRGIRRLPVVTADGQLDGILALDDVLGTMSTELSSLVGLVTRQQTRERNLRK